MPSFTVFDADGNTPLDEPGRPTGKRTKHEKDNTAILQLSGVEQPQPFPAQTLWVKNVVAWPNQIGEMVEQEIGADELRKLKDHVSSKYGIFVHDKDKNTLFLGYLMAEAWDHGKKSPTLEKLCRTIIDFAKSLNPPAVDVAVEAGAGDPAVAN